MPSRKREILEAVPDDVFPITKEALIDRLEGQGVAPDTVLLAATLADARFVDPEELEQRLDEALGVPPAFPTSSALAEDGSWPADR